ncbi:MAG: hypothetical protein AAF715_03900 [Myxococcota bacterium]
MNADRHEFPVGATYLDATCPHRNSRRRAPGGGWPLVVFLTGLGLGLGLSGCGDGDGDGDGGGGATMSMAGDGGAGGGLDDGKLRPPGNGMTIGEEQACDQMQSAFRERQMALGCSFTVQLCPGFVRGLQLDAMCRAYDEGSVRGCIDAYRAAPTCAELDAKGCVPLIFPDTDTCN